MKEFKELPQELQTEIQIVCDSDPYGLNPITLYKNILHSTASVEAIAQIFEVMPLLVKNIKEEGADV